ncbi:MAG: hypothetical protein ABF665_04755 [Gluconacetobacter sp.]
MSQHLQVDGLDFKFDDDWMVAKFDDWSFYRKQFSRMRNEIKSIDLIAASPDKTSYFVEVKDYRVHRRTKPSDIGDEVSAKVFDTLAALLPAQVNANDEEERKLAYRMLRGKRLKVVLHLEQPAKHSKLFPRTIDPANVVMKLRQRLKPIDAHPAVTNMAQMHGMPWVVT